MSCRPLVRTRLTRPRLPTFADPQRLRPPKTPRRPGGSGPAPPRDRALRLVGGPRAGPPAPALQRQCWPRHTILQHPACGSDEPLDEDMTSAGDGTPPINRRALLGLAASSAAALGGL